MNMHIDTAGAIRPMTDDEKRAAVRARRERLLKFHTDYLDELREAAPAWVDASDESLASFDPAVCELLAETAPDDSYMRGYWLGKASVLHGIRALTERASD